MTENIKLNLDITMSKLSAVAIIILSPIFLEAGMILSGWILAGGLLGWKQGADAIKTLKNKPDVK